MRIRRPRPGHAGELTRYLPFELVDDVLESTGAVQKRMRALPPRVGMYFVLAMTLFPGIECGAGPRSSYEVRISAVYPVRGKPGINPAQLAVVTVQQFAENLTDRQAAGAPPRTFSIASAMAVPHPGGRR